MRHVSFLGPAGVAPVPSFKLARLLPLRVHMRTMSSGTCPFVLLSVGHHLLDVHHCLAPARHSGLLVFSSSNLLSDTVGPHTLEARALRVPCALVFRCLPLVFVAYAHCLFLWRPSWAVFHDSRPSPSPARVLIVCLWARTVPITSPFLVFGVFPSASGRRVSASPTLSTHSRACHWFVCAAVRGVHFGLYFLVLSLSQPNARARCAVL